MDSIQYVVDGFVQWLGHIGLWRGHKNHYADWMKQHPECDPTSEDYDEFHEFEICQEQITKEEQEEQAEEDAFLAEPVDEQIQDEFNYLENEIEKEYNIDEIREDGEDVVKKFTFPKIFKLFVALKWVYSIVLIGLPWCGVTYLFLLYNIVGNAWLNEGWAEGNFWLLANTFYAIVQTFLSWNLFLEFYPYLQWFAIIRVLSAFWAVVYNAGYLFLLFGWLSEIFMLPLSQDDPFANVGFADVAFNMMMVYNSVLHAPIYVLNVGIIWKEFMMLIFNFGGWISGPESKYALTWKFASEELWDDLWIFDPFRFVPKLYGIIFKTSITNSVGPPHYVVG